MAMLDKNQIEVTLEEIELELARIAIRWGEVEGRGLGHILGEVYIKKFEQLRQQKRRLIRLLRDERHSGNAVEKDQLNQVGPQPGEIATGGVPRITGPVARDVHGGQWSDAT